MFDCILRPGILPSKQTLFLKDGEFSRFWHYRLRADETHCVVQKGYRESWHVDNFSFSNSPWSGNVYYFAIDTFIPSVRMNILYFDYDNSEVCSLQFFTNMGQFVATNNVDRVR